MGLFSVKTMNDIHRTWHTMAMDAHLLVLRRCNVTGYKRVTSRLHAKTAVGTQTKLVIPDNGGKHKQTDACQVKMLSFFIYPHSKRRLLALFSTCQVQNLNSRPKHVSADTSARTYKHRDREREIEIETDTRTFS